MQCARELPNSGTWWLQTFITDDTAKIRQMLRSPTWMIIFLNLTWGGATLPLQMSFCFLIIIIPYFGTFWTCDKIASIVFAITQHSQIRSRARARCSYFSETYIYKPPPLLTTPSVILLDVCYLFIYLLNIFILGRPVTKKTVFYPGARKIKHNS